MATQLQAFTRPNVDVNDEHVHTGSNTDVDTPLTCNNWKRWKEFNYDTLTAIFRTKLEAQHNGERAPRLLATGLDTKIYNEESFDDVVRRFISPVVNYALEPQQPGAYCYSRGTLCGTDYKPDWSLVSDSHVDTAGYYIHWLPGDTKLSKKWSPEMLLEERHYNK